MGKEQFVGTWKLISMEVRRSNGDKTYPYGENPLGMITYTPGGHMHVQLLRPGRPRYESGDLLKGTPEEVRAAAQGMIVYHGTYELKENDGQVIHHIQGSSFPNWEGGSQVRFFNLEGQHLTLSTPPILLGSDETVSVLVWERIA